MKLFRASVPAILAVLFTATTLTGQDPRGSIRGRIADASGAVIPGVEVSATNNDTGVRATAQANGEGIYNIPFLLPGFYTINAELSGFKTYNRANVQVRVSEVTDLAIAMEVGATSERIEVTAETPLLDTASSSMGQVIDSRRILELPIAAGNPLELTLLTPGMIEPSKFAWKAAWNFRNITSDGNPAYTSEYQIDGVSNTFSEGNTGRNRYAFAPPASAVQEFKMQTTPYDASIGHTMSGVVNVSTKNGTNELHGEAHWFTKNSAFDAPNFFNNKNRTKPAKYQDNRYGASGGGPVVLPKLYNGRNKTFWHYDWEANKWAVPQTFTGTVPTEAQRRGDFSQLLNAGITIYDPLTTKAEPGGRYSRTPFAGNIIPQNRLDKVGTGLANLYPLPNQTGDAQGRLNYFNGAMKGKQNYFVHMGRVDQAWTDAHRTFVRVHYDWWEEDKDHQFSNDINGIILNRINRGLALDHVWVLNPTLVLNVRYGLTNQDFLERRSSKGYDLASLGFSSSLLSLIDSNVSTLPRVSAGPFAQISRWESGDGATTSLTHSLGGHFTKLLGSHSLKFGTDARLYRAGGNRYPRGAAPDFSFGTTYTRGPLDNSPAAVIGQELASMLLGIPDGGMERSASFAMQDVFYGFYLHDDFKLTPTLTLNLGLRYELEVPVTERFDRLVAGYDFTTPNPIEAAARANYAASPMPGLSVDQFRALGGLTWVGANRRSPFNGEKNNFMPRIGLAWQLLPKTTFRAGYGLYYDSIGVNSTRAIQTGFSQNTPIQASLDEGLTWYATAANPFPAGLLEPLGPSGGLRTSLSQSIEAYVPDRRHPYSQRWSAGLQQLLPGQFLAEASYVGSRATRLPVARNINATPRQYLSTLPVRDQAAIDYLSPTFTNPFFGLAPGYTARIARADLLRPYPHFGNITVAEPIGYSWYHSMQIRAERRFAQGFTFQLGYTWSKLMEALEMLNVADTQPYEVIGSFDRTHRLAMSGIWEIPVGRGRAFGGNLPSPVNFVIGGWQLGGIVVRQSGAPLGFGNAIFNGNLHDIVLPKDQRSVDRWFNTEAGFNRVAAQQLVTQYQLRTFPLRFSGIRGDGRATWDFSAIKNFNVTEQFSFQLRAEVYNAWNHPNFSDPRTTPQNSDFGRITGAGDPRNWQFSLRAKF